ncbi:unnamed protein product [Enterobius vermicularis]|uniref:28S ribosomal protein S6, mitochondrial n=1 Tax=Enterobius vermicularis TaxID=51028 RepID=A0A0N4VCC6_ENTVE|nr:unnamed protein product [Enterobius vermicularis]
MPYYELSLVTRPLAKDNLFNTLRRVALMLMDHGAIIEKVESLGHRDLPFKRLTKQTREPVYTSNYFLMKTFISREEKNNIFQLLLNDLDVVHVAALSENDLRWPKFECNLAEILKPPSQRESVKLLRETQKLGHFTRQRIFKRSEREWRSVQKSYPIPPPRN